VLLAASLSFASQGELTASDRDALINVRTSANTEAEIIETRPVGDRVEVLTLTKSNEGSIWYKIKVPQTGTTGWVRGDLIKIFGAKKPASTAAKPAKKGKPAASVPLPKPTANPKPIVNQSAKAPASKPAAAAAPTPKPSPSPAATAPQPSPSPSPTPTPAAQSPAPAAPITPTSPAAPTPDAVGGGASPSPEPAEIATATIMSFQTPSYAVRIFSRSGQLRLNLFNRRTNTVALKEVPIQSKTLDEGTTYSYSRDLEVTVFVPNSGATRLTTSALGATLEEYSEPTPAPGT
jgi:outer membrane biosynthesis protein TonB